MGPNESDWHGTETLNDQLLLLFWCISLCCSCSAHHHNGNIDKCICPACTSNLFKLRKLYWLVAKELELPSSCFQTSLRHSRKVILLERGAEVDKQTTKLLVSNPGNPNANEQVTPSPLFLSSVYTEKNYYFFTAVNPINPTGEEK